MISTIKNIVQNKKLLYSVLSQLVTLTVSVFMTVGVTKYITVESYGFWQLFIFYASYMGLAHFGICDGLYLTYGGSALNDLNKKEVKGMFYFFFNIQLIASVIIILYASIIDLEETRRNILYVIAGLLIIANSQIFFGYILLATNNIVEYAKSVFLEKFVLLFLIFASIFLDFVSLESLIFSFVLSKIASLIYLLTYYRSFIFSESLIERRTIYNLIKIGGVLMISNIINIFILGVGRYFIDKNWGIIIFGKISLSISLVYFVLVLLSQMSFVLFPYLRNISEENQKNILIKLNQVISLILKGCILLYFPLISILHFFLPNYNESIKYLILLLPLCFYDGKMQILYVSYFRNLFLQRQLLLINLISFAISLVVSLMGSYLFRNLDLILLGIVISIISRAIFCEIILRKKYGLRSIKAMGLDLIFSAIIIVYYFVQFNFYLLISLLVLSILSSLSLKSALKYANRK